MITVLLIDDYEMVRRGLEWLISSTNDLSLIGIGTNGYEAVQLCEQLSPDVLLIDAHMPFLDGVSATRKIRAKGLSPSIIIMSSFIEEIEIEDVFLAGANAHIFKDGNGQTILDVIRRLAKEKIDEGY